MNKAAERYLRMMHGPEVPAKPDLYKAEAKAQKASQAGDTKRDSLVAHNSVEHLLSPTAVPYTHLTLPTNREV